MNWTYGGIRIFVQDMAVENKQIISRLHPFAGGTIHHIFGWEDDVSKVEGYAVGPADILALKSYTTSGTTFQLDSPYGTMGDYLLNSLTFKLVPTIAQTMRTDLDCEAPVYTVNLELYKDV